MDLVFGKGRGYQKPAVIDALNDLRDRYEQLLFDYAMNPALRQAFEDRYQHALAAGMDPERFIKEEKAAFVALESKALERERQAALKQEVRRRRLAGETFADKVLDEYRERISHYPELSIHPDADPEVSRLYGALALMDTRHWNQVEDFLRKAFPQAGNLDRMNVEQRWWRLIPNREGRLPSDLERYRQVLSAPSATNKEKLMESQESIKSAAFFLHELLEVLEKGRVQIQMNEDVEKAVDFIHALISDFRLKELKRR